MKVPAYSSLAAFLAHYHALKSDPSRGSDDEQLLAGMSAAIATLAPEAGAALDSVEDSARAKRHRDRAALQLRRELAARGIVAG
ncbi:hypothetical protein [Candidatus Binatus sp.]|uniref:hypothetical protein n=1 Tax=Candidatus Binatus sp. TaxID=2811406 RepID=UPI002FDB579D